MANTKPPSRPAPEHFDESTKVHSADDIDEILRKAAGPSGGDDFGLDEHTKIGPAHELAVQSMAVPDPMPAMPTPTPRPANVIRRSSPSIPAVRASTPMPAVEAFASGSDIRARAPSTAPADEDPFAEWNEFDQPSKVPEPTPAPLPAPPIAAPRLSTPMPVMQPPAPVPLPMPVLAEPVVKPARRIGLLVWGLTVALAFAGGAYAFRTITTLSHRAAAAERAAAAAKHQADEARAAAAATSRELDATKTQLYEARAALDAANAERGKRSAAKSR